MENQDPKGARRSNTPSSPTYSKVTASPPHRVRVAHTPKAPTTTTKKPASTTLQFTAVAQQKPAKVNAAKEEKVKAPRVLTSIFIDAPSIWDQKDPRATSVPASKKTSATDPRKTLGTASATDPRKAVVATASKMAIPPTSASKVAMPPTRKPAIPTASEVERVTTAKPSPSATLSTVSPRATPKVATSSTTARVASSSSSRGASHSRTESGAK